MHVFRHAEAHPNPENRDIFTGPVSSQPLVTESMSDRVILNLVQFSAGGRTKWHRHSFEQGLVIVAGRGIVASEDAEHIVVPGDVVYVTANEKHWHGATEQTSMAHIAINQPGDTTVLEAVNEIRTQA
jgi:quercetin dioxygenase-like cupin family protein